MKILHMTDDHGDNEARSIALKFGEENKVDVYAHTGDLLGKVLSDDMIEHMNSDSLMIARSIRSEDGSPTPFDEKLEFILKSPNLSREIREPAIRFRDVLAWYEEKSREVYREAAALFKQYKHQSVVIPGNWDNLTFFEYFGDISIHNCILEFDGLRFGGWGGADARHMSTPICSFLGFNEHQMYSFLAREDPDVALLHAPPTHPSHLETEQRFPAGSFAALAYVNLQSPSLVLCGHLHKSLGVFHGDGVSCGGATESTIVNSGTLGRKRCVVPGTFSLIELDENGRVIDSPIFYQIGENGVREYVPERKE